jgi:hypothetical protein
VAVVGKHLRYAAELDTTATRAAHATHQSFLGSPNPRRRRVQASLETLKVRGHNNRNNRSSNNNSHTNNSHNSDKEIGI